MPIRLTAKEVISILLYNGFECILQKGSHQKWRNVVNGKIVIVPYHQGKQLPQGTLNSIIKGSGLDKSEFGFI